MALAQTSGEAPMKARLRVQQVSATASVNASTQGSAASTLRQILDAADTQLLNAVEQTRKFEMVPRDLNAVIREQDLAMSGNVNRLDPQAAKALQMAGVKYVAIVTVDNFQDITQTMQLEGGLGKTNAERRVIQLQAVIQVVESTKATVLRSTSVKIDNSATSETMAGASVEGRATNALTGAVARELATRAANEITDVIYPAKVVGYTMGVITFNRTKASGVDIGQYWELFAPGPNMVDPDTGESLGAEEVSIGWCVISDAGEKFSKAAAIVDNGIDKGTILRRRNGLPAGVDQNQRVTGSSTRSATQAAETTQGFQPIQTVQPVTGAVNPSVPVAERAAPLSPGTAIQGSPAKPSRLAIFVKNRAPGIPDERVMAMEDQITATATDASIEIIRREDVANAVARFATAGANAGMRSAESEVVDRLLSDRASATSLAQMLGADGLIVASMSSFDRETAAYNDGVQATTVDTFVLRCTYAVLDGASGGSLGSGTADSTASYRQTANLKVTADPTNTLLTDSGRQIGAGVRTYFANQSARRPSAAVEECEVQINTFLADMRVPRINRDANGEFSLTAETVEVGVFNAEVLVDGVSVGAAPGTMRLRPGLHKLRVQRQLCEPEDRMINVRPGMIISVPLRLTAEGRAQWMQNAAWFDTLKTNENLREVERVKAKAFADFLSNCGLKINLDTSGWGSLLGNFK
ncbi:MAG: PEGA domain-containing protein [Planctomycetes bacterium]|nr:PEGA domain-containing protein [Planctomycetota bacterium]